MDNRKKSHFNILDILIIITVAAIVTAIALRYDVIAKVGLQASSDSFDITFIVENIQQESEQYFTEGEQFIITKSLKPIGTLKEVLDVNDDLVTAEKLHIAECCACGACSYICPARRTLSSTIKAARDVIAARRMAR